MKFNFFSLLSCILFGLLLVLFLKQEYFQKSILDQDYEFYIHEAMSFETVKSKIDSLSQDLSFFSKFFFNPFLNQKRLDYWYRPGRYVLKESSSVNDIVDKLRSQSQDPINFTFNSMDDVSNILSIAGNRLELDSVQLINYLESINLSLDSLYFLLIPNTYEIFWNVSPQEFLDRIYFEYNLFWNQSRLNAAHAINLSKKEVFVLASIVDKEASHVDEMSRIAGLYLNRITKNWFLAADPTIIYAYQSMFNESIRRVRHKHIDKTKSSLFNTYHRKGLPPIPICVPSFQSIDAVLYPEQHEYMYMCARPDASEYHNFAKTYFQHKKNASSFHKWLNSRKIF